MSSKQRPELNQFSRVVVKIGTNTLSRKTDLESPSPVDEAYIDEMARQIHHLKEDGKEIILVSSGAIGMGAMDMGINRPIQSIEERQAFAAIGQPLLMDVYREAFGKYGLRCSQLLVTQDVLSNRSSYMNLRNSLETLLELKVIPVVNENDSVSTAEIGTAFGDNDKLSALVASKMNAQLLIILSDVDGIYESNPKYNSKAKRIPFINDINDELRSRAGSSGSKHATGGMLTKLDAVEIAKDAGCHVLIAEGRQESVLLKIFNNQDLGSFFYAEKSMNDRKRWIKNTPSQGTITIDDGAMNAILNKRSLLPRGVTAVTGIFPKGSVISAQIDSKKLEVKMVSSFTSRELDLIQGKHSDEIETILGSNKQRVIARPEDMVILEK